MESDTLHIPRPGGLLEQALGAEIAAPSREGSTSEHLRAPYYGCVAWYHAMGIEEATALKPGDWSTQRTYQQARPGCEVPRGKALPVSPAASSCAGVSQPVDSPATPTPPSVPPGAPSHPSNLPAGSFLTQAVARARALADGCTTLEALKEAVEQFDGCQLKRMAQHTVFADGNPKARIMLIGEAPGAQEDIQGIPFCGESGQLLDKMFAAIGLSRRESLYIPNTIFWRPPANRKPTEEELAMCRPFMERHSALIAPRLLVLVGATAAQQVLQTTASITNLRQHSHQYRTPYLPEPVAVWTMFHPAYLLRQPSQKKSAWNDLLKIKKFNLT